MRPIVNVHVADKNNIGDMTCAPLLYFDIPNRDRRMADLRNFKISEHEDIVVGGGGLLYPSFHLALKSILNEKKGKAVFWGGGLNTHGITKDHFPDWMNSFNLVGCRDWGQRFEWVPCASAMSPLFDKPAKVNQEIVVYEHHHTAISIPGFERMRNNASDFSKVIEFLGSAETVMTNTYHGVYWSILLGKKVVIIRPFSSRFHSFKWPVSILESDDWKAGQKIARAFPEALRESREANLKFYGKVLALLK